jgi:hypothetical protein
MIQPISRYEWVLAIALALLLAGGIAAQVSTDKPITPTVEQQELIRTVVELEGNATREVQLAQARQQAAQARTLQVMYSVMAELGLPPSKYTWKVVEGKVVFEKLPEKKQ